MSPCCTSVLQDKPLYGHDGILVDLVASPDGRWIASVSDDPTLIIWRLDRGDGGTAHLQVALDWTPDMYTSQLQFSPNNRYLASLSQQLAMTSIWDVTTGTLLGTLGGLHPNGSLTWGTSIAWLQDGTLIAYEACSQRLLRWCISPYHWGPDISVPSTAHPGSGLTTHVAVLPDATYSATDRGLVQMAGCPDTVPGFAGSMAFFSPDGSQLILPRAFDDRQGAVWEMDFGTLSPPLLLRLDLMPGRPGIIAASNLAKRILVVSGHEINEPRYAIIEG